MRRASRVALLLLLTAAIGYALLLGLLYLWADRSWMPPLARAPYPATPLTIAVGANIHVSHALGEFRHRETVVAAHPRDPNRLVTASIYSPPDSDDGSTSWRVGQEFRSDPGNSLCASSWRVVPPECGWPAFWRTRLPQFQS